MFSIYTCGFNLIKHKIEYQAALRNFISFAEEVVVAVNQSDDGSVDEISRFCGQLKKENAEGKCEIKIIVKNYSYDDIFMVGKLKNDALQATVNPFKIGLDLDERIPVYHKQKWLELAYAFQFDSRIDSYLIPSLNLWGSNYTVRDNFEFNRTQFRWYLHKEGCFRGTVNFAKRPDGFIDITKSDTCELINDKGDLVKSVAVYDNSIRGMSDYLKYLSKDGIFIFHLGYADLNYRIKINKEYWLDSRIKSCGGTQEIFDIQTDINKLKFPLINHGLRLWNE